EGRSKTFSVQLKPTPGHPRTVTLTSNNPDITIDADPDQEGEQSTLTFTQDKLGKPLSVKLTAKHDDDSKHEKVAITFTGDGIKTYESAAIAVIDDDVGLNLSRADERALKVGERSSGIFVLRLKTDHIGSRTPALAAPDCKDVAADSSPLDFTGGDRGSGDWSGRREMAAVIDGQCGGLAGRKAQVDLEYHSARDRPEQFSALADRRTAHAD
ncbi:MAG: hypothetical protein ISN29_04960, partial [Gammaproteobacteria bacterium AqS3]|nr:hypothetical protein [Gammaproteobacteria bacterium AqS3]